MYYIAYITHSSRVWSR